MTVSLALFCSDCTLEGLADWFGQSVLPCWMKRRIAKRVTENGLYEVKFLWQRFSVVFLKRCDIEWGCEVLCRRCVRGNEVWSLAVLILCQREILSIFRVIKQETKREGKPWKTNFVLYVGAGGWGSYVRNGRGITSVTHHGLWVIHFTVQRLAQREPHRRSGETRVKSEESTIFTRSLSGNGK